MAWSSVVCVWCPFGVNSAGVVLVTALVRSDDGGAWAWC